MIHGGAECSGARSSLGATAWFVLEELALRAEADVDGQLFAQVSTRKLAAALGLNKDMVTRGLARLHDKNLIVVVSRPDHPRLRVASHGSGK